MPILYHYVHCPYCVRIRLALGFFNIAYDSKVIAYDNETLPVSLCGKKMLPIYQDNDGTIINESLDIIHHLDKKSVLFSNITKDQLELTDSIINEAGQRLHPLAIPQWANTLEFQGNARTYFMDKKEASTGSFMALHEQEATLKSDLSAFLDNLDLPPVFFNGDSFSILDIQIASHLYGLYSLIDFYIPRHIHDYLQRVRHICHFNYHEDYMSSSFAVICDK